MPVRRVYLSMPKTVAPKSGTISFGISEPEELAGEILRSEALALWYEVTINPDIRHDPPLFGRTS
jgi:hypothetical protein